MKPACWIFSFKQEYRWLVHLFSNLIVLPWWLLQVNPLVNPAGVALEMWLQIFVDAFSQHTSLLLGSKGFILDVLHELYEMYGTFDGSGRYPTFLDLLEMIDRKKIHILTRTSRYREAVRNRLRTIILALGEVLNCSRGLKVSELVRRSIVFEMHGLTSDIQNFLVSYLLWAAFAYFAFGDGRSARGSMPRLIIFLDEAQRVFDKNLERRPAEGIPSISTIVAQIRPYISLVVAAQMPSQLLDSIKANTDTKIIFKLGHGRDLWDMARSASLDENMMAANSVLQPGQAIVKTGKYERPFIVQVPLVEVLDVD